MAARLENVERFNREINEYARDLLPRQLVLLQKKIVFEVLRGVVGRTPVDTGRARGNWQVSIGAPKDGEVETKEKGPRGEAPQAGGGGVFGAGRTELGALPRGRPFQVVFITNNVPYIVRLEEGWSKQAPQGMLAVTFAEVAEKIRSELLGGGDVPEGSS
uniref:Putative tail protein n=1 Tax=viral metagenome TaxID=1070528 RepID=A0A6M3JNS9_9ZZZZ